jgi:NAD(P)-dependent dehydrogenase (short-subunit alcohol dehydrogenase family)
VGLLNGKTTVTIGGTGIGLASAARFVDEGAPVFITGRRQAQLDGALGQLGERANGVRGDVGAGADLDRSYAAVAEAARGLDVVVANAGVTAVARIGDITEDHLDTLPSTNIKGVVFTVQKALPLLSDGASILITGSTTAGRGRESLGGYAATKAAVRSFARNWANELKGRGIRVNVVAGSTATPGSDNLAEQTSPGESITQFRASRVAGIPLGRFGEADEIANAALFLASELASFTTGSTVTADGGADQI